MRPGELPLERLRAIRVWMFLSLTAVALCTLLGGCASMGQSEQSDQETLPWSEPAAWERTTIGVPF